MRTSEVFLFKFITVFFSIDERLFKKNLKSNFQPEQELECILKHKKSNLYLFIQ